MPKNVLIIFIIILIVLVASAVFFMYNQKPKDLSKVSDSQIISFLNKNSDAKDYMQSHGDFKIESKEILTKESIVAGQNGQIFREVYQGLELQDNRYMKVNLMNPAGDSGLVAVLDFNKNIVLKAYGIMLLKVNQPENGQK